LNHELAVSWLLKWDNESKEFFDYQKNSQTSQNNFQVWYIHKKIEQ